MSDDRSRPNRDAYLRRTYGISLKEWDDLFERQGNACAGCQRTDRGEGHRWHTDHDYNTGVVRGILCHDCNIILTKWATIEQLQRLIDYLLNPPADVLYKARKQRQDEWKETRQRDLEDILMDQAFR